MDAPVRTGVTLVISIAVLAAVQWLASRQIEPFLTYLYFFSWIPFLWALDRLLVQTRRRTFFGDASARASAVKYVGLAVCSTTVWLVFEALNFRLMNWRYIGVPPERAIRWPGYAFSYMTVLPGLLFLADLLGGFEGRGVRLQGDRKEVRLKPDPTYRNSTSRNSTSRNSTSSLLSGGVMLALPMLWPRFFFPLIWLAFIFLLDPYVARHGGRSLVAEWRRGDFKLTGALLVAGMLCGIFWEACNFLAGAKWIYDVPFVGFLKIFEMPILGFFGFPVFALEAFVMTEAARTYWQRLSKTGRWIAAAAVAGFWLSAFAGIDAFTVQSWRASIN